MRCSTERTAVTNSPYVITMSGVTTRAAQHGVARIHKWSSRHRASAALQCIFNQEPKKKPAETAGLRNLRTGPSSVASDDRSSRRTPAEAVVQASPHDMEARVRLDERAGLAVVVAQDSLAAEIDEQVFVLKLMLFVSAYSRPAPSVQPPLMLLEREKEKVSEQL